MTRGPQLSPGRFNIAQASPRDNPWAQFVIRSPPRTDKTTAASYDPHNATAKGSLAQTSLVHCRDCSLADQDRGKLMIVSSYDDAVLGSASNEQNRVPFTQLEIC